MHTCACTCNKFKKLYPTRSCRADAHCKILASFSIKPVKIESSGSLVAMLLLAAILGGALIRAPLPASRLTGSRRSSRRDCRCLLGGVEKCTRWPLRCLCTWQRASVIAQQAANFAAYATCYHAANFDDCAADSEHADCATDIELRCLCTNQRTSLIVKEAANVGVCATVPVRS